MTSEGRAAAPFFAGSDPCHTPRMSGATPPFSKGWMFSSVLIFIAVELALSAFVSPFMSGAGVSHVLRLKIHGMLNISGYFIGGVIVGLISPGVRILEPAVAAVIAVGATLSLSFFTPYWFYSFSMGKLLIGGAIAFVFALMGAHLGESWVEKRRAGAAGIR